LIVLPCWTKPSDGSKHLPLFANLFQTAKTVQRRYVACFSSVCFRVFHELLLPTRFPGPTCISFPVTDPDELMELMPYDSDQNDLSNLSHSASFPGFCRSPFGRCGKVNNFRHSLPLCLGAKVWLSTSYHACLVTQTYFSWSVFHDFSSFISFLPCLVHFCADIRSMCMHHTINCAECTLYFSAVIVCSNSESHVVSAARGTPKD